MHSRKMATLEIKTDHYHETPEAWAARPPVNVACAVVALNDCSQPLVHVNRNTAGVIQDHLSREQVSDVLKHLAHLRSRGYNLVSWNGTAFDLQTMADITERYDQCAELALNHYDIMFQIFCNVGWPVSLAATAKGMGICHSSMTGPELNAAWQDPGARNLVVDQAIANATVCLDIAHTARREDRLRWHSHKGNRFTLRLTAGLLTVSQSMQLPPPDTSWMTETLERRHFVKWLPGF